MNILKKKEKKKTISDVPFHESLGYAIQKKKVVPKFVLTDKLKQQCEAEIRHKLSTPCNYAKSHFVQGCKYFIFQTITAFPYTVYIIIS
jgi:hypothetical protein